MKILANIILIVTNILLVSCDFYTSLYKLKQLLKTEENILNMVKKNIMVQETVLLNLKRYERTLQKQYDEASKDIESYVQNPFNVYLLVKRLTLDLHLMKENIKTNNIAEFIDKVQPEEDVNYPSNKDLAGVVVGLNRLKRYYGFEAVYTLKKERNIGDLLVQVLDLCHITQIVQTPHSYEKLEWLQKAYHILGNTSEETHFKIYVLKEISSIIFELGNIPLALRLVEIILELDANHEESFELKKRYERELQNQNIVNVEAYDLDVDSFIKNQRPIYDDIMLLCNSTIPVEKQTLLKCYYSDNNSSFLKIAPFKIEEVSLDPRVIIFHNVIYDKEIEELIRLSGPKLKRAEIINSKGQVEITNDRISAYSFLCKNDHKYVNNLYRRAEDMTQLDQKYSEQLQILNYGIGGHYYLHYDHFLADHENDIPFEGNRIATLLFYLTSVKNGGVTIFPDLNIIVPPEKGSALFWHNLFPSGDGNEQMIHAACPVLAGSKWIATLWMRERNQEFRRPCGLEPPPKEYVNR